MDASASDTVLHLFGRRDELSLLSTAFTALQGGDGGVVVVSGQAGIGKTTLIEAGLSLCDPAVSPVRLAAEEWSRLSAFGMFADVLRTEVAVPNTVGDGEQVWPGSQGYLVQEALAEYFEQRASREPLVVIAEDLHWADPASLQTLGRIGRIAAGLPLVLVASTRPVAEDSTVAQLIRSWQRLGAVTVGLEPIDSAAAVDLVAEAARCERTDGLVEVVSRAGGNPLFLTELAKTLVADGLGPEVHGSIRLPSLQAAVLNRLANLTPSSRQLLAAAAILGNSFYIDDLAALIKRSSLDLDDALREVLREGILHAEGDRAVFAHDLVHDAVYDDIPAPLRVAHHREAARLLTEVGASLDRIAAHLVRSAQPGDHQALEQLEAAAVEAGRRSPPVAVELWRTIVDLLDPLDPMIDAVRVGLAGALVGSGRAAEAAEFCASVVVVALPGPARAALVARLCQALLFQGRWTEARAVMDQALESVAEGGPRARLLALRAASILFGGDFAGAIPAAQEATRAGADLGDVPSQVRALTVEAQAHAEAGRYAESVEAGARALVLAVGDGSAAAFEPQPYAIQGLMYFDADRAAEAEAVIDAGVRSAESLGARASLVRNGVTHLYVKLHQGEWDHAVALFDEAAQLALELGLTMFNFAPAGRAFIALQREGPAASQTWLDALGSGHESYRNHQAVLSRAMVAVAQGDIAGGKSVLHAGWSDCVERGRALGCRVLGPTLAWVAMECGEQALALDVADKLQELADEEPTVRSVAAAALVARGLAESDSGSLRLGVEAYAPTPRRLDQIRAEGYLAVALAREGEIEQAREVARSALAGWAELGADWASADLVARLREAGLRLGSRGARARAAVGWDALSPAEERVALLVAEGWSNPQIAERLVISRRTVESHVARVLAKLGLRSRAGVRAVLPDHGKHQ